MGYRYTKIKTSIYHNEKFRALSEDARTLYIYFLASPHSNILGCYVIPQAYISSDLQWKKTTVTKPLGELFRNGLIAYDEEVDLIVVVNHLKHNKLENPNQVKAAMKILDELPKSSIMTALLENLTKPFHKPLANRLETLSKPSPKPEAVAVAVAVTEVKELKRTTLSSKTETRPNEPLIFQIIIEDLNLQAGKKFRYDTKSTKDKIQARLNEGYTVADFKEVHRVMVLSWGNDPKMRQFLRPETLYAPSHFDSYLNQPDPDQPAQRPTIYYYKKDFDEAKARGDKNIKYEPKH